MSEDPGVTIDSGDATLAQRIVAALALVDREAAAVDYTPTDEDRAEAVQVVLDDTTHLRWSASVDDQGHASVVVGDALSSIFPERLTEASREAVSLHTVGKAMRSIGDRLVENALVSQYEDDDA